MKPRVLFKRIFITLFALTSTGVLTLTLYALPRWETFVPCALILLLSYVLAYIIGVVNGLNDCNDDNRVK